jgi:diguanylate cyclase (GGDEF)-like protein
MFSRRKRDPLLQRLGLGSAPPEAVAALHALEAERAALEARLAEAEKLADRDGLTPTLNRRGFVRELHRAMSFVERYKRSAAVIYLDLDGFKAVNDAYGHAAGDVVLRYVGRLLVDQVRESDVVGRLGGDEFAVILHEVSKEEARRKADALAQAIEAAIVLHEGVGHRVRASLGLHIIDAAEDPELAIARADEAMYAEKHARKKFAAAFESF